MSPQKINIIWFRRDLRLEDNTALIKAAKSETPLLGIFIFDKNILSDLNDKADPRVNFIHNQLTTINAKLWEAQSALQVFNGNPMEIWEKLIETFTISTVFVNRDYEPYARQRDQEIYELLASRGIPFVSEKDQVIFEKSEIVKDDGSPYKVYTPYSKKWKLKLQENPIVTDVKTHLRIPWLKMDRQEIISLDEIGFQKSNVSIPPASINKSVVSDYHLTRDFPAIKGTSRLGIHLRFGTISLRTLVTKAASINEKFLNELIWRDFYQMILWHFPRVVDKNFNRKYDTIKWRNDTEAFRKWCSGNTGYPIVDAGMRELNATGYMHNRVRMVVASFLTKHLLIDWKWGEAYFAEKLLDFELASNNGGWQWAAGTGVDAAPYFRVFNPEAQTKKFDTKLEYIRKWVPEFQELNYARPIVDHKFARERVLKVYKEALES